MNGAPKKRGRPAKDDARTTFILVRLSAAEREALARAAGLAQIPLATWVRAAALLRARFEAPAVDGAVTP